MPLFALGLGSTGVSICYLSSVAFIPITIAAVIFYTFPILIVVLSPIIDRKPLTFAMMAIVLAAFIGSSWCLALPMPDLIQEAFFWPQALAFLPRSNSSLARGAGKRARLPNWSLVR